MRSETQFLHKVVKEPSLRIYLSEDYIGINVFGVGLEYSRLREYFCKGSEVKAFLTCLGTIWRPVCPKEEREKQGIGQM